MNFFINQPAQANYFSQSIPTPPFNPITQISNRSENAQLQKLTLELHQFILQQNLQGDQYVEDSMVQHLELNSFKVTPCSLNIAHSHKKCPFYHNYKDRKRNGNYFSGEMCPIIETGQFCPLGDSCPKAHNRVEQLYRSDTYKTKFCTYYPGNIEQCEYGMFCSFAHSEEDIVIELIHNLEFDEDFFLFYYKTVWCPFNLTSHDKGLCVYAHNWQDFRRKPNVYGYQPIACGKWKAKEFIQEYSAGCSNKFNCERCHGWKELEYHPLLFRTKQCLNQNCVKADCSYYHNDKDRRIVSELVQRIFKITPRNRITSSTFDDNQMMSDKQEEVEKFKIEDRRDSRRLCNSSSQQSEWKEQGLVESMFKMIDLDV